MSSLFPDIAACCNNMQECDEAFLCHLGLWLLMSCQSHHGERCGGGVDAYASRRRTRTVSLTNKWQNISVMFVVTFGATQSRKEILKYLPPRNSSNDALVLFKLSWLQCFFSPNSLFVLFPPEVHWRACEASPAGSHGGNCPNVVWMIPITDGSKRSVILLQKSPGSQTGGVCHNTRKLGKCPFCLESKTGLKSLRHFSTGVWASQLLLNYCRLSPSYLVLYIMSKRFSLFWNISILKEISFHPVAAADLSLEGRERKAAHIHATCTMLFLFLLRKQLKGIGHHKFSHYLLSPMLIKHRVNLLLSTKHFFHVTVKWINADLKVCRWWLDFY